MELKKNIQLSLLLSLSVVFSIIESMIPIFNGIVPGLKLGLANIIVLFVLYIFSFKDAVYISILRVFLVSILRTGVFSVTFFFSLGGAVLSVVFMFLFKKITKLSIIGISIIGAIFHSIGQVIMAVFILETSKIIYYLPFILILAIPSGIIIGIISKELVNYFEKQLKND